MRLLKTLSPTRFATPPRGSGSVVIHLPSFHLPFQSPKQYAYPHDDNGTNNIPSTKCLPRVSSEARYDKRADHYGHCYEDQPKWMGEYVAPQDGKNGCDEK